MISDEGAAGTQLTNTGFALGTPGYMAPEQARGGDTDERTDVYAVGVILYHMIAGRKPFVAESPMAVLRMHMDDPPLPLRKAAGARKISPALDSAVLRALEKDPARRWQSASEFADALAATPEARGETIADAPPQKTVAAKKLSVSAGVSRRWGWLVILGLVAGGGGFAWSRLSGSEKRDVKASVTDVKDSVKSAVKNTVDGPVKTAVDGLKEAFGGDPRALPPPGVNPPKTTAPPVDDEDDDEPPPKETPGAQLEATAPPVRGKPSIDEAVRLLGNGKVDPAIQMLYQVRRQAPKSPAVPLLLGHAYFRKLWRTDGLREYEQALKLKPSLRKNPQLIKNVVSALDDPTSRFARSLVRSRLGAAAIPELRRAARTAKSQKVQQRASKLAASLRR
jgi:hypothetical protein